MHEESSLADFFEAINDYGCDSLPCRYRSTSIMDARLVLVLAGAGSDLFVHLLFGHVADRHNRISTREVASK